MNRGNGRKRIFRDDRDHREYLRQLVRVISDFGWKLYAYVLMPNHYHLMLEIVETNLSRGMHVLDWRYARWFNRRHQRCGHLFQSRFKSPLVEPENYLLELTRYIALNPVRAHLVQTPEDWPWSSYRATAGLEPAPDWLQVGPLLDQFRAPTREMAQQAYRNFVMEGCSSQVAPPIQTINQFCVGSKSFRRRINELAKKRNVSCDLPQREFMPVRPDLSSIVAAVTAEFKIPVDELRLRHGGEARNLFAYIARQEGTLPLGHIGAFLNLTPGGVSHLVKKGERLERNQSFELRLRSIRQRLQM